MDRDFLFDFVAGWFGGCAGLFAGHPMDTIKVRQQVLGEMTITKCLVNTVKYEGIRGFYKGLGFPLLTSGAQNSIFFGVYGSSIRYMTKEHAKPSYRDIFLAGCAGGTVQLIVGCPVDLVKIKMQMQTGSDKQSWTQKGNVMYKGPTACLIDLYKKGGVSGCYRGMASMTARDVPSFGLYMVLFEAFIRAISGSESNASPASLIFCGGMAGALSWLAVVPFDVLKSRIQADDPLKPQFKGMWDCLKKSYKIEGMSVFTRGIVMVTARAFPSNGAIFLGYVTSLNVLRATFSTNSGNSL